MAFEEYKSQGTVNAEQVEEMRSVITPQGAVTAQPGQWEVRYPDGDVRVLDDEAFQTEWGSGDAGESDEESQPTLLTASAGSDTRADKTVTTADAGSESDSSPDSDRASETEKDSEKEPEKVSTTESEKDSKEPPV